MTKLSACAHCGAEIQSDATFCRHCGSSDSDGWSDEADVSSFSTADNDEYDYDEFIANEFGDGSRHTTTPVLWRFVAVILLFMFFVGLLFF